MQVKKITKLYFYLLRLFSEYYILLSIKLKITTYRFKGMVMGKMTFITKQDKIVKRSGKIVDFDASKIYDAISKAVAVTNELNDSQIFTITQFVLNKLDIEFADKAPTVEQVQDIVIQTLMDSRAYKTAESYIVKSILKFVMRILMQSR